MSRIVAVGLLVMGTACDSNEPSVAEALEKAEQADKARKEAEAAKKAAVEVEDEPAKAELPWTIDALKEMKMGTVATYALTGVGADGKDVEDTYVATFKGGDDRSARVNEYRESNRADPVSNQVKTIDWSRLSPLFAVERPESKVLRRETVSVPAGEFDAVVVEIEGFFGAHITAWMIADQPGIYAKVVDHGNENEPDDQTELVYALQSVDVRE